MKKALITGITGQDGPCLIELLLEKGYKFNQYNNSLKLKAYQKSIHN